MLAASGALLDGLGRAPVGWRPAWWGSVFARPLLGYDRLARSMALSNAQLMRDKNEQRVELGQENDGTFFC